jgi:hypothetical protein
MMKSILITLLVFGILMAWYGLIGQLLWNWFVAPSLNLPTIGYVTAIGFALIAHLWTTKTIIKKEDDARDYLASAFVLSSVCLIIGFLLKTFAPYIGG